MIDKEYTDFDLCMHELQEYATKVKGTTFVSDEKGDVAKGLPSRLGWIVIPEDPNHDSNSEVWFNIKVRNVRKRNWSK